MSGRFALLSRAIVAALMLVACMGSAAYAEKRVALVVGNSAYQNAVKLPNPDNDAKLMSDTLLSLGFFVVGGGARLDLDKAGFDAALKEFSEQLVGADAALFYYAGHGVEIRGLNYLVPVDADPKEEADILSQMTSLAGILDQMQKSGARINIALLDACRNNPFRMHLATEGLAQMQAPPGTLISFATQPRSVALDGDDGHSPYTRALADTMTHPGYGLFKTFNEVGLAVEKDTRGAQLPWVSSSPISGNFYFAGKPLATPASLTAPDKQAALTPSNDAPPRSDLVTSCDWLAAMPFDAGKPQQVPGVESDKIDVRSASAACADAMQRYPDVPRFAFEAARVAYAKNDYAEARRLYLKADEGGYRMAANNIGNLYEDGGFGVREDYAQAFRWYKKAADAGEPVAMFAMAWLYETGKGVAKDCPEAIRLYETAGKAGLPSAINNIGLMYDKGSCAPRDAAQAYRYFAQAAAQGDAQAMNNLGTLYNDGRGVPRDRKLAKQWLQKAAALGVPEAKQNLKGM
jgi:TPR repeat protein